jgi:acyl carrier protein
MSTLESYKKVFVETFEINDEETLQLEYMSIPQWDSVGHMTLMGALEDEFDIVLEMDDIIDFSSFKKGIETLAKYNVNIE